MRPDARLRKKTGPFLEPGEVPYTSLNLTNGRGSKELPVDPTEVVLTDRRLLFLDWPMLTPKGLWRAVGLHEVTGISTDQIGARINRSGEVVVRFHIADGSTVSGIRLAAGGGRKDVDRFVAAFHSVALPPAAPPPPPPG